MGKSLTAMGALARGKAHMGIKGWRDHSHPRYRGLVRRWAAKPLKDLPSTGLLGGVSELLDAGTAYYTAVQSVIPIAATSEIMFRAFYDRLVRRAGDPSGQTFPARVRQRTHPCREVAVRPCGMDPRAPGACRSHHLRAGRIDRRVGPDGGHACRRGRGGVGAVAH